MMRFGLLAGAFFCAASAVSAATCAEGRVAVAGPFGQANFKVDVADDNEERARGLMFVDQMPTLSGMLFVYDEPRRASFWMKNTLIPLDMLFADPAGVILRIHENAIPGDTTSIDGGVGVQYVLEINGGLASRLGIAEGDTLQHPTFGPDAAAPCEN
jgi:uncharacterized membrane protein (UPF0127 family)